MASNVIRVSILADAKRFGAGFREAEGALGKFQGKANILSGVMSTAIGIKATQAVKQFVDDSVRAFSDLEQSTGAIESVFGAFASDIEAASRQAGDAVGLSAAQYQQLAANLGGMLQNLGYSVAQSASESQILIGVGADLAATYGGSVADAVNAISSLLRGERDPIERYAVSVKDADIKARALAMGLDMSTSEAKKQNGAIAALDILYQQSSKTAGQFAREQDTLAGKTERANARLENQKAVVGEVVGPIKQEVESGLWSKLGGAIAEVALEWQMLTGEITKGAAALKEHEAKTGEYVDTAEEAIDVSERYHVRLAEIVEAASLTTDELRKLRDMDKEVLIGMGHSIDEVEHLARVLESELSDARREEWKQAREILGLNEEVTESYEDQEQSILDVIAAHRAATDPVANAIRAGRELKDAQQAYNDALRKHGPASQQAEDAALDLLDAQNDLDAALADIATKGGPNWRSEFRKVARQAGLAEDSIDEMIRSVERADGMTATIDVRAKVRAPHFRYIVDNKTGTARPRFIGTSEFHEGVRRVPGTRGQNVPAVLQAGERVLSAAEADRLDKAQNGAGTVINITVEAGISDPYAVAEKIAELLQQYNRISGPLNMDVRTL